MVATPMKLEDALRLNGYGIEPYEFPGATISTEGGGKIVVPPLILSRLSWMRPGVPLLNSAMYLDRIPAFHPTYAPVQLSLILDRFRARRIGYATVDEFAVAVRRWGALHMGATSVLTKLYTSTGVALPLDTVDLTVGDTSLSESTSSDKSDSTGGSTGTVTSTDTSNSNAKSRDARSDFPQSQLSGSLDYASGAVDSAANGSVTGSGTTNTGGTAEDHKTGSAQSRDEATSERRETGRSQSVMALLEEQRSSFLNADERFLGELGSLFLSVFDQPERDPLPYLDLYGW